jgi:hypothetical protein
MSNDDWIQHNSNRPQVWAEEKPLEFQDGSQPITNLAPLERRENQGSRIKHRISNIASKGYGKINQAFRRKVQWHQLWWSANMGQDLHHSSPPQRNSQVLNARINGRRFILGIAGERWTFPDKSTNSQKSLQFAVIPSIRSHPLNSQPSPQFRTYD